ncbi:hypothetical protein TWF506_009721 [Arthrobotrys conoides]|uniref:GAR domain-containing protein n=1 Tax=Arthrobotrys conoides TaxID=74498 RepID=A0AAN8NIY9_9PEZI
MSSSPLSPPSPPPSQSSRPPPIQTTFSSPLSLPTLDRPRPPNHHHHHHNHHHLSNPPSALTTPKTSPHSARFYHPHKSTSSNPSSAISSSHPDPLLSRLTPTTITKMSDQDFLPGEKEVGVWAASAAEKIDSWLEEVEAWEAVTFWSRTDGEGFRIPSRKDGGRKKRRKIDLEVDVIKTSGSLVSTGGGGGGKEAGHSDINGKSTKLPVARRLFTEEHSSSSTSPTLDKSSTKPAASSSTSKNNGIRIPSLKLSQKTKDTLSMSQIDELLSPTATPLLAKRLDLDNIHHNGSSSPMTPGRLWTSNNSNNNNPNRPLSPFSPYEKLQKRRSLQVSHGLIGTGAFGLGISTGAGTPTILKRQTFDFTPRDDKDTIRSVSGGSYRPSSSPTKSAPLEGNPFLGALPPTSNPTSTSPRLDPATDSETDLIHSSSPSSPIFSSTESSSEEEDDIEEEDSLKFLGSLTQKTLTYISTRITTISTSLSELDIEGLKSRVLHFKSQQIDELGNGRMSDSLAVITATTLQLLPPLHRLWGLLDIWGVRVEVCRVVPTFLENLRKAEGIILPFSSFVSSKSGKEKREVDDEGKRWLEEIAEGVPEDSVQESTLWTLERGVDVVWEKRKAEVVEVVGMCGKIIDGMLDLLEGREETVPEEWIDRLEAVEGALENWAFGEEGRAEELKRKWKGVVVRRREDEERVYEEEVERRRFEAAERARRVEEERLEMERLEKEEEQRQNFLAEQERLRKEEEKRVRQAEEERLRQEADERLKVEEGERQQREELERLQKLEAERLRLEEEERLLKIEEERRLQAEEEERIQKEAEAKRRREEEDERLRLAYLEQVKKDEEEKKKKEIEEEFSRKLADQEAERRKAEEQRIREIEERMMRKYEEMERLAEEEERKKAEEALKLAETPIFAPVPVDTEQIITATAVDREERPLTSESKIHLNDAPPHALEPQRETPSELPMREVEVNSDSGVVDVLPLISEDIEAEALGESEVVVKNVPILLETEEETPVDSKEAFKLAMPPQMQVPLLTPIVEERLTPMIGVGKSGEEVGGAPFFGPEVEVQKIAVVSEQKLEEESVEELQVEVVRPAEPVAIEIVADITPALTQNHVSDEVQEQPEELPTRAVSPIPLEPTRVVSPIPLEPAQESFLEDKESKGDRSISPFEPTDVSPPPEPQATQTAPEPTKVQEPLAESQTHQSSPVSTPSPKPTEEEEDAGEDTVIINSYYDESAPSSPILPAHEIITDVVEESILPVSPLQTPPRPKSKSNGQLDIVTDISRPISPVLNVPESVPVLKIQAATPIEGRHASVVLDMVDLADQLGGYSGGYDDFEEEEFMEPDVRVVISEEGDGFLEPGVEGVPELSTEVIEPRPLGVEPREVQAVDVPSSPKASPAKVIEKARMTASTKATEEVKPTPTTFERLSQPSPYLAPAALAADDYVSDIDDSDVATEADDEEFQEELRKERLGEDSLSPVLPTTSKFDTATKSPLKAETEQLNGTEVQDSGSVTVQVNGAEVELASESPKKLVEPVVQVQHNNVKDVVGTQGGKFQLSGFYKPKKKPVIESFGSLQSLDVAKDETSQASLSPTGSVIHHQLDDSFGQSFNQSFNSARSEDTVPDAIGPDITIDEPVADPVPQTPTIEEEEVSPIKEEFGDVRFGEDESELKRQEPEVTVDGKTKENTLLRRGSKAQEPRPVYNFPTPPKPRQSSVSSSTSSSSKVTEAAARPARHQGIRRVSSIPTIAPPRTQVPKEVNAQDGRSTPQLQRPSQIPSGRSSRQNLRPESRLSGIPKKASSNHLAEESASTGLPKKVSSNNLAAEGGRSVLRKPSSSHLPTAAVPKRTSSANKTEPALAKKKGSISGLSSREIAPKTSTQELRNIPSRTSSRIGSRATLRGQGSTQSLKSLPSPTLARDPAPQAFDNGLKGQGSKSSLRGFQLPTQTPQPSPSHLSKYQAPQSHASSPTYEPNQTIKVVKRKNNLSTKAPLSQHRAPVSEKERQNGAKSPDGPTPDFPSLRHVLNPPSTPMKGKELEDRLERKIHKILIGLPTLTMTPSPMKKPVPPPINTSIEPPARPRAGESKLPVARTPSTPTIGQAPNLTVSSKRTISQPGEVKMYHLHKSDEESPVKLFVRLVGDKGERVMVRVGGGWADLKEYLIEYASHHGIQGQRKTPIESVVEFGDDARSLRASGSNSSLRSSYRGSPTPTFGNSRPSSPLAVRGTPGRAESPYSSRKQLQESPRYSYNGSERTQTRGSPITPKYDRPVTPGSAGMQHRDTYTSPNSLNADRLLSANNFRRPTSRLSFGDFPDTNELPSGMPSIPSVPLGLAGPKSRNLEISAEKQAWVDGMLGQVRKASAERNVRLGLPRMGSANSLQSGGGSAIVDDDNVSVGSGSGIGSVGSGGIGIGGSGGPRLTDMGRVGGTRRMYATGTTKPVGYLGMQKGAKGSSSSLRQAESGREGDVASGKQASSRGG